MSFGSPSPHLSFARRCEQSPACRLTASFGVPCCAELIYRTSHEDGYKLVAHPRLAGTGYTGAWGSSPRYRSCVCSMTGLPRRLEPLPYMIFSRLFF